MTNPETREIFSTGKAITHDEPAIIVDIPDWASNVFVSYSTASGEAKTFNVTNLVFNRKFMVDHRLFLFMGLLSNPNFTLKVEANVHPLPPEIGYPSIVEYALFALRGAKLREDEAMELICEIIRRIRK